MDLTAQGLWHLDEADRLEKIAAELPAKPGPVASIHDMTEAWMFATIGPERLRTAAAYHRTQAARIARQIESTR